MRIAIVGAGFSGLAVCWHLLNRQPNGTTLKITVLDPAGIGEGVSGLSAGMLHTYTGAHSKLCWKGREGLAATRALLEVASKAIGEPVANSNGILRPATTTLQQAEFARCASENEDAEWWDAAQCQHKVPGLAPHPALLIRSGIAVNSKLYLAGLWRACSALGAELVEEKVATLSELTDFDVVVVAMGMATTSLSELSYLPLKPIKGQILKLEWPKELPPLQLPLNSLGYLTMLELTMHEPITCFAGATFERSFASPLPDRAVAIQEILPKIEAFFPAIKQAKILDCYAGLRAAAPNHKPIAGRVNPRTWVLTGMGSKGLIHHAWLGQALAEAILAESDAALPAEVKQFIQN